MLSSQSYLKGSYKQCLYLDSVVNNEGERFVTDEKGNSLKSFNKLELQKLFSSTRVNKMVFLIKGPTTRRLAPGLRRR